MAYGYPYGNGQQLNLDWFLEEWKNLLAAWEAEKNGIDGALQAEIDRAEAALADVFAARDAAAQSASAAGNSASAAAQSAQDASGYLATVRADANTASNAARNAAQSESNAADSAQTALASKNNAANSERNAAQSEQNALGYKNAAAQSAEDAQTAEQNVQDTIESATEQAIATATQSANDAAQRAGNSASAASQSEQNALGYKNAAAQSAEDAEDAAASVEASAEQIATNTNNIVDLRQGLVNMQAPITKEYTSIDAFVTITGLIQQSTASKTGLVKLKAGESIILGTRNDNISIIASTLEENIAIGDTVSPIYTTLRENRFGTVVYTATEDINIVFCYRASEYTLAFANLIHDIIAPSLGDMQTPTALQINDFRIVNNKLFRITAPIAAHAFLTPNTNCEEVTVADILKTLLI